jgi:hypothetical protein
MPPTLNHQRALVKLFDDRPVLVVRFIKGGHDADFKTTTTIAPIQIHTLVYQCHYGDRSRCNEYLSQWHSSRRFKIGTSTTRTSSAHCGQTRSEQSWATDQRESASSCQYIGQAQDGNSDNWHELSASVNTVEPNSSAAAFSATANSVGPTTSGSFDHSVSKSVSKGVS